ncbi:hypothetical protein ACTG9Q_26865 [Actinokineospora sp. 24-640]
MNGTTRAPRSGVLSPHSAQHWTVPPWPRSANVHDVVDHFIRFTLRDGATDLERLTYYETYVAALETAREHSAGLERSAFVQRWYHDLHDALLRCLEQYRLRCEENECVEQRGRVVRLRDGELPGAAVKPRERRPK